MRLARLLGMSVPGALSAAAVGTSFILVFVLGMREEARFASPFLLGGLAVVWGVAGLVSLAGVVASLFVLGRRRPAPAGSPDATPAWERSRLAATGIVERPDGLG
jgi:hypothetical protein